MKRSLDRIERVIGFDTHKAFSTASVVSRAEAEIATITVPYDDFGHRRQLAFARRHGSRTGFWAIQGTGSFGAGLTTYLVEQQERVAEIDRAARPVRRNGAKTADLGATRAPREALSRYHLAQPRCRGDRQALQALVRTRAGAARAKARAICHVNALIVTAPTPRRDHLRQFSEVNLPPRAGVRAPPPAQSTEHRATVVAIRLRRAGPRAGGRSR